MWPLAMPACAASVHQDSRTFPCNSHSQMLVRLSPHCVCVCLLPAAALVNAHSLQVPSALGVCGCSISVKLSGHAMKLPCPPDNTTLSVTDYMWQTAAEQRYTCWADGASHQAQLLDYLASPSNNLSNADTTSIARGDGGGLSAAPDAKKKGVIAGAVIGVVLVAVLFGLLGYYVVYKRLVVPHKATAFRKFEDDAAAAPAAGAAGLPPSTVPAAAAAAARPV